MFKRRIIYLIIILVLACVIQFYFNKISLLLLMIALFFPVILYLVTLFSFRFIAMAVDVEKEEVNRGKDALFKINIVNTFILPVVSAEINFKAMCTNTEESTVEKINFKMSAGAGVQIKAALNMKYCGHVKLGIESMSVYDCLKMFSLTKTYNNYLELWIHPRLLSLETRDNNLKDNQDKYTVLVELYDKEPYRGLNAIYETCYSFSYFLLQNGLTFNMAYYDENQDKVNIVKISSEEELNNLMRKILMTPIYSDNKKVSNLFQKENDKQANEKVYYISRENCAEEYGYIYVPARYEKIQNTVNEFYELQEN